MTTYDNGAPFADWKVAPKHCGQVCFIRDCPVCGVTVNPKVPANVELGEN